MDKADTRRETDHEAVQSARVRGNFVEVFLIFALVGALLLCFGEIWTFQILADLFNNDRFIQQNVTPNTQSVFAFLYYYGYNLIFAGLVAVLPAIYCQMVDWLPIRAMVTFSLAVVLIAFICMAVYLNFARVTLPSNMIAFYIFVPTTLCTFFPLWGSYLILRLYWLLRKAQPV